MSRQRPPPQWDPVNEEFVVTVYYRTPQQATERQARRERRAHEARVLAEQQEAERLAHRAWQLDNVRQIIYPWARNQGWNYEELLEMVPILLQQARRIVSGGGLSGDALEHQQAILAGLEWLSDYRNRTASPRTSRSSSVSTVRPPTPRPTRQGGSSSSRPSSRDSSVDRASSSRAQRRTPVQGNQDASALNSVSFIRSVQAALRLWETLTSY